MLKGQRGSAPVESIAGMVLLMLLTLGALQVAFALYARNVVASAAHEGVRALVERDSGVADAETVATTVVERATGGLVEDLSVDVTGSEGVVRVHVRGRTAPFGPVPITVPLRATATSVRETP